MELLEGGTTLIHGKNQYFQLSHNVENARFFKQISNINLNVIKNTCVDKGAASESY